MKFSQPVRPERWSQGLAGIAVLAALAFVWQSFALIDATSLWRDELSTAYKVYQPSLSFLLDYLRRDSHPPVYYVALWGLGRQLTESAFLLRCFSWFAYVFAGVLMGLQAGLLARASGLSRPAGALALALLLAFSSPFPVRYSIEAKGYAFLVALLSLGLLSRQQVLLGRGSPRWAALASYGTALALAAATHYYGLLYALALLAVDGWAAWRSPAQFALTRFRLCMGSALASLPVGAWIVLAVDRTDAGRATSWIGPPEFGLLEDVLVKFIGPYPLPKLVVVMVVLALLLRSGLLVRRLQPAGLNLSWLDVSGLLAGIWMVVVVVLLSFWKPIAFARYFIVLLPGLVVWFSCQLMLLEPRGSGGRFCLWTAMIIWIILAWTQSFEGLRASGADAGSRESSNFRAVSLAAAPFDLRFGLAPRHLTTSDRLLAVEGQLPAHRPPWRDPSPLREGALPAQTFVLAATGSERVLARKFAPLEEQLQARGCDCRDLLDQRFVRVLTCQPPTLPLPVER
ncbi:MAG: hypothetical protein RLZZ219_1484 [Cyanobacteriota bacterium]